MLVPVLALVPAPSRRGAEGDGSRDALCDAFRKAPLGRGTYVKIKSLGGVNM